MMDGHGEWELQKYMVKEAYDLQLESFFQHVGSMRGSKAKQGWWRVRMAVVWILWKHRNDILFNKVVCNLDTVVEE